MAAACIAAASTCASSETATDAAADEGAAEGETDEVGIPVGTESLGSKKKLYRRGSGARPPRSDASGMPECWWVVVLLPLLALLELLLLLAVLVVMVAETSWQHANATPTTSAAAKRHASGIDRVDEDDENGGNVEGNARPSERRPSCMAEI